MTGKRQTALWELGFRPFFLGAAVLAPLAMLIWHWIFIHGVTRFPLPVAALYWHSHEMIYGYAMAVIAGFLLTAVGNWTGQNMPTGTALASLALLWASVRLGYMVGFPVLLLAGLDLLFMLGLLISVALPILRVQQWHQMGILSKLLLLCTGNVLFYLGALGVIAKGVHWGIYLGLYLIMGLILTMSRRVMPGFIERGVGYTVVLRNSVWVDRSSLVLFVLFVLFDLVMMQTQLAAWVAILLMFIHLYRLIGWYTHGIWQKPLLWSLWVSYLGIILGFPLYAASYELGISPYLAVHAFAVGGIGMITLSMMARVSLGHSGHNVHCPPAYVTTALLLMLGSFLFRVLMPLISLDYYWVWISLAQICWIASFLVFLWIYLPIWVFKKQEIHP